MVTGKYDDPVLALLCFDEDISVLQNPKALSHNQAKTFVFFF